MYSVVLIIWLTVYQTTRKEAKNSFTVTLFYPWARAPTNIIRYKMSMHTTTQMDEYKNVHWTWTTNFPKHLKYWIKYIRCLLPTATSTCTFRTTEAAKMCFFFLCSLCSALVMSIVKRMVNAQVVIAQQRNRLVSVQYSIYTVRAPWLNDSRTFNNAHANAYYTAAPYTL